MVTQKKYIWKLKAKCPRSEQQPKVNEIKITKSPRSETQGQSDKHKVKVISTRSK